VIKINELATISVGFLRVIQFDFTLTDESIGQRRIRSDRLQNTQTVQCVHVDCRYWRVCSFN